MRFEQLIAKVQQAEDALEAQERRVVADLRQLRRSWHEAWTPGRIVLVGLVSGFLVGRAEPLRQLGKGGNLVQIVSMLSSLFAGGSAQVAAEAAQAAESAATGEPPTGPSTEPSEEETLARAEATLQAARAAAVEPTEP